MSRNTYAVNIKFMASESFDPKHSFKQPTESSGMLTVALDVWPTTFGLSDAT